eukprot:m.31698 g.31698  ORF g.31698 m.31698 type:complete len:412 (-) comp9452_c0_seq4:166-1401(-)
MSEAGSLTSEHEALELHQILRQRRSTNFASEFSSESKSRHEQQQHLEAFVRQCSMLHDDVDEYDADRVGRSFAALRPVLRAKSQPGSKPDMARQRRSSLQAAVQPTPHHQRQHSNDSVLIQADELRKNFSKHRADKPRQQKKQKHLFPAQPPPPRHTGPTQDHEHFQQLSIGDMHSRRLDGGTKAKEGKPSSATETHMQTRQSRQRRGSTAGSPSFQDITSPSCRKNRDSDTDSTHSEYSSSTMSEQHDALIVPVKPTTVSRQATRSPRLLQRSKSLSALDSFRPNQGMGSMPRRKSDYDCIVVQRQVGPVLSRMPSHSSATPHFLQAQLDSLREQIDAEVRRKARVEERLAHQRKKHEAAVGQLSAQIERGRTALLRVLASIHQERADVARVLLHQQTSTALSSSPPSCT